MNLTVLRCNSHLRPNSAGREPLLASLVTTRAKARGSRSLSLRAICHAVGATIVLFEILLLASLTAATPAAAEGCGRYEDESSTSHRSLRWADFQGTADRRPARSAAAPALAYVATTIRVEGAVETRKRGSDEWVARIVKLCVRAFMLKNRSHYNRGETNRFDLVHEQGHFDITALYSERLAIGLAQLEVVEASRGGARSSLRALVKVAYRKTMAASEREQRRYDRETRIRSRRDAQARWTSTIQARLSVNGRKPQVDPPCVYVASPYWFVGWAAASPPIGACDKEEGG